MGSLLGCHISLSPHPLERGRERAGVTKITPERARWLRAENLFDLSLWFYRILFELPWARRMRTQEYWSIEEDVKRNRSWDDDSPVPGCIIPRDQENHTSCDDCKVNRHMVSLMGYSVMCPQRYNAFTTETCFGVNDLCGDCEAYRDHGCGFGGHECNACVANEHRLYQILITCTDCGECPFHGDDHCRQACPGGPSQVLG